MINIMYIFYRLIIAYILSILSNSSSKIIKSISNLNPIHLLPITGPSLFQSMLSVFDFSIYCCISDMIKYYLSNIYKPFKNPHQDNKYSRNTQWEIVKTKTKTNTILSRTTRTPNQAAYPNCNPPIIHSKITNYIW